MWRPKGWKGYIERLAESNGIDVRTQSIIMPMDDESEEAFESGADAMLDALRLYALEQKRDGTVTFKVDDENPQGTFVVLEIPDDKELTNG